MVNISTHCNLPPQHLTQEQIQQYIVYLTNEKNLHFSSCNVVICAMRCFFNQFLNHERPKLVLPPRKTPKRLPVVLSKEEVFSLIESSTNFKHRIILMTVYAAGLRLGEVINLKVKDIDSKRMTIFVRDGKGNKDRYTILSETLLKELKHYYAIYRPTDWLFYSTDKKKSMCRDTVSRIYKNAKTKAGITKGAGIHTLRHCFATHLVEDHADIRTVQKLMGHAQVSTTMIYLHVTRVLWDQTRSPLDGLMEAMASAKPAGPFYQSKGEEESDHEP